MPLSRYDVGDWTPSNKRFVSGGAVGTYTLIGLFASVFIVICLGKVS